jgi:hypothetical protein
MQRLKVIVNTKREGLDHFCARGWILVDATYEPVNRYNLRNRNEVIIRDYPLLRTDLLHISPSKSAPILLLKANVCALLEARLRADGFDVINRGRRVAFPSHGQQPKFHRAFAELVAEHSPAKIISE